MNVLKDHNDLPSHEVLTTKTLKELTELAVGLLAADSPENTFIDNVFERLGLKEELSFARRAGFGCFLRMDVWVLGGSRHRKSTLEETSTMGCSPHTALHNHPYLPPYICSFVPPLIAILTALHRHH